MNKTIKRILSIILIIITFLIIDTIQAKIFNNSPIVKITEKYSGNIILRTDKGIIVETAYCANGEVHTYFKWNQYICPIKKEGIPTN